MSQVVDEDVVQEGEVAQQPTSHVANSLADVKLESEHNPHSPTSPNVYTSLSAPTDPHPPNATSTSTSSSTPTSTSPFTLPQSMPLPRGIMDDTTLIVHTKEQPRNVNSFTVSVTDPERKGEGMYQYMSYKCNTLTETSDGTVMQSSVVRRFSDFVWLHERLSNKYRGVLIPPIPEKAIIGRFSVEFLNERRRGLETFLNRIGVHSELRNDSDVYLFLHGDESSLNSAKDSPLPSPVDDEKQSAASSAVSKTAKAGRGIMSFFKETVQTISNTFGATKEREKTGDDVSCDKVDDYATHLETQLTAVHANMEALIKRNRNLAKNWFEFGLSCTLLGQFESSVKEQGLGNMFAQVGNCADQLSVLINKRVDTENTKFREPLKDYIRLAESVKQMMKARAAVSQQYQTALSSLESARAKLSSVSGKPGSEDRVLSVERQVQEAQSIVDQRFQELNRVTEKSLAEYERFKQEKEADMKQLMVTFVKLQIEHTKKVQAAWEAILPEIEGQLP